jgi:hypothetical protein
MKLRILVMMLCVVALQAHAQYKLDYELEVSNNFGAGDFAPYFINSNTHGVISQTNASLAKIKLKSEMDNSKRFSFGYGATLWGGVMTKTAYSRYNLETNERELHKEAPSSLWIQQLYGELKYRSVFLVVGLKERGSNMLNDRLSSGDMTYSANSRPMPGVRAGFFTPQDIPFTNGWVQISGEIGYYKQTDAKWLENHYAYYNSFITKDLWFNYKYCYFHLKPSNPFSLTLGMQAAAQFGGELNRYENGKVWQNVKMTTDLSTFVRMLIPGAGGNNIGDQAYVEGSHIGSWDIMGRYRFSNGSVLKAYYQSPWEDGSGIGMMNGFDGLYGIEYKSADKNSYVTGAVVEYLDLMNQGGPLHWDPVDMVGTPIVSESTGSDNYYNNYTYNGYQYYGRTIGSPVLRSPIYNTDGYLSLTDTRLRSFHVAVEGRITEDLYYRAKFARTKSWGTIFVPISVPRTSTSAMVECVYDWRNVPGLKLKGQVGLDRGSLYGNNFGMLFSVSYRGMFNLK